VTLSPAPGVSRFDHSFMYRVTAGISGLTRQRRGAYQPRAAPWEAVPNKRTSPCKGGGEPLGAVDYVHQIVRDCPPDRLPAPLQGARKNDPSKPPRALPWAGSLRAAGARKMTSQRDFVSKFENQDTSAAKGNAVRCPKNQWDRSADSLPEEPCGDEWEIVRAPLLAPPFYSL